MLSPNLLQVPVSLPVPGSRSYDGDAVGEAENCSVQQIRVVATQRRRRRADIADRAGLQMRLAFEVTPEMDRVVAAIVPDRC